MAKRVGFIMLLVCTGFLLTGSLVLYLAFSAGPDAPRNILTTRVMEDTEVSWSSGGALSLSASSFEDGIVALGYGHARSRSWQMILWRQAAQGRLSEWFGEDAVDIDRLMRQLKIAEGAESAWANLTGEPRIALTHYAEGVNLAITSRDLNRGTPFLLLDVEAERWEPWHSIAIERLFAWIASEAFPPSDESSFALANRALQEILHIYGFDLNTVTTVQGTDSNTDLNYVAARYATGDTGIPFFVETTLDYASGSFVGLTVPGGLIAPLGLTHADSWALLLSGTAHIRNAVIDRGTIRLEYGKVDHREREELFSVWRTDDGMVLSNPDQTGASAELDLLVWSGFGPNTDTGEWLGALKGKAPAPNLISRSGVAAHSAEWLITGSPKNVLQTNLGLKLVTSASSSLSPVRTAETLAVLPTPQELLVMEFSQAARDQIPALINRIPDSLLTSDQDREALRYLNNWNHVYGAAEPGASIAEEMLREIMPQASVTDAILITELHDAVTQLTGIYGTDMSSWRWETVQDRRVQFPGTTTAPADGGRKEISFYRKYGSVLMSGPGHSQTFTWGTVRLPGRLPISSAWEGSISRNGGEFLFRRPSVEFDEFLGTFITADRPPLLQTLVRSENTYSTTLLAENQ